MKHYIVYNKTTGQIIRTGSCPSSMLSIQAHDGEGELVMEGQANDEYERIVDGKVTRKTDEEIALIEAAKKPDPRELLIKSKTHEILRRMAIDELQKEGKLP